MKHPTSLDKPQIDGILIACYGGGTNSTAMLIGMAERGIRPDAIVFADTGGEKPHTYEYIEMLSNWLEARQLPAISVVRNHQPSKHGSLEAMCLANKILPSIAYGFKSCSVQYKIEPQDKFIKETFPEAFEKKQVIKAIGFDAGEPYRAVNSPEEWHSNYYPLIEWGWSRSECIGAITDAGLPLPGKSACFFCPNTRPSEIRQLNEQYPELIVRALAIESNADNRKVSGLGRNFSWASVLDQDDMFNGFERDWSLPCGCYDG